MLLMMVAHTNNVNVTEENPLRSLKEKASQMWRVEHSIHIQI